MILYHFVNLKYGLENISNQRLKISTFNDLNDPFECLGINLQDKDIRHAYLQAKAALNKAGGIICFSASWRSPLQWAHYADRHRGICLGFEILKQHQSQVHEVKYVNTRPHQDDLAEEDIINLFTTKFSDWSYEKEHRLFVPLNTPEKNGLYFTYFNGNMNLKEIFLGANCKVTKEELKTALGDLKDKVKISQTRPGFANFEMVINKKKTPVRV